MIRARKQFLKMGLAFSAFFLLLAATAILFPQWFLCVDSGPVKADVIVVLGGGSHERPGRAAELFRGQIAPRIIVSGLGDYKINRQLLIEAGVPSAAGLVQAIWNSGSALGSPAGAAVTPGASAVDNLGQ